MRGSGRGAQIQFKTMNTAIFGFENIVTVYLAAMLALENAMTVGMIFAFMAYKMQFTGKASTLVEKALEFRLLDLHLERLSDIARSEEHTSELQSRQYLVCRLLLEKK